MGYPDSFPVMQSWMVVLYAASVVLAAFLLRHLTLWALTVMQYMTLVFEIFGPIWFCWGRARYLAVAYGFTMPLMIALLMKGLIYFGIQMWALSSVFMTAEEWWMIGNSIRVRMDSVRRRVAARLA